MKLRLDSLGFRVILFSSLWAAAAIALLGWLLIGLYRADSERGFDQLQEAQLFNLVGAVSVAGDGTLAGTPNLGNAQFLQPGSGWYWRVVPVENVEGRPLVSPSLAGGDFAAPPLARVPFDNQFRRRFLSEGPDGETIRVLESEIDLGEGRIARFQVAGNQTEFEYTVGDFARRVGLMLALFGLGVVVINAAILLYGLRPLDHVRRALAAIRNGAATSLEGRFPSEIEPLVEEMNALIDNNRRIVERSRTQVGNLAHSLKTPLSVLTNEAAAKAGPSAAVVAEQARAMDYQIQHYLKRARIAAQRESIVFRTEVGPVAEKLVSVMRKLNPDKRIDLQMQARAPVFMGEKEDLEEILGNLLENAGKWARERITLAVGDAGTRDGRRWLSLVVEDDGPGIDADKRETALKRGKRIDESVPGTGLGLSIVAETAGAYGGSVELGESEAGGLRVDIVLPAAGH
ncbi:ATP-binding protein [Oricola thermophila]|uniref:histidine kinase n=1 Tax=Oricola thermophila TaxID=2742145 RepID=A0A6N1VHI5_9HYPH|nr:ATP-binding protein [Oricola thermophila]QKV18619.1 histidine kinase [Oricola thermophila]